MVPSNPTITTVRSNDSALRPAAAPLAAADDYQRQEVWRRITDVVVYLTNLTPTGPVH